MAVPSGPLVGVRIVELAGIGPGPYAAMLLADLGAEVLRIDRPQGEEGAQRPTAGGERTEEGAQRPTAGGERTEEGAQRPTAGGERTEEGAQRPTAGGERTEEGAQRPTAGGERTEEGAQRPTAGGERTEEGAGLALDADPRLALLHRGRRSAVIDLRRPEGSRAVLQLAARADVLLEGYRPGVAERLGVGPDACFERNPALVYGRMTGWGQDGPLARTAGHDINYLAPTGALHAIGRPGGPPTVPLNVVGDFGGGGALLAVGVLAALLEARTSGRGQVVDAAITDGVASLMTMLYGALAAGWWRDERGVNLLDGGAPFYDLYETADGRWISVGALEEQFYAQLCARLGLDEEPADRWDPGRWPQQRERFAAVFKTRTRQEWAEVFDGTDACVTPVMRMSEAPGHPHLAARSTFVEVDGVAQPAPVPRFSRTPGAIQRPPPLPGEHTRAALHDWGVDDVEGLLASGAAVQHPGASGGRARQ